MSEERKVFVSYSRADKDKVLPLVKNLEKSLGIKFWIDLDGIESAAQFEEVIIRAIDQAEVVLFMLSDNSQHSQWTKDEVSYAKNIGKRVVPIILYGGGLEGWFLFKFGRINYIDASEENQLQRLVKDLRMWLHIGEKQALPDLSVLYAPNGADVYVDGIKKGTTPCEITGLSSGSHSVEISLSGYETVYRQVSITANVVREISGSLTKQFIASDDILTNSTDSSATSSSSSLSSSMGASNGHDYVDLGLSVKWATCNLGASSPLDYGDYYAWGETSVKSIYTTQNSRTYGNSYYNCDMGGNESTDAARACWGSTWRLPTKAEAQELVDKCAWIWTKQGDKAGYQITSQNGNSIFLPATGFRYESLLDSAGEWGNYWTSSPNGSFASRAFSLYFSAAGRDVGWSNRCYGRSIRPVCE